MHLLRPLYKFGIKPVAFRFDPETVHNRLLNFGNLLGSNRLSKSLTELLFKYDNPLLSQDVDGVRFKNPVGLSAGFDKNAELVNILDAVGFGHAELGSVTFNPYKGNPKPRLTRLPKSKGIVVYYGLKNQGIEKIAKRIPKTGTAKYAVGVSIAKTNADYTADTAAGIEDYYNCLKYLIEKGSGDYYTINISCPNTFGGEPFTTPDRLDPLLNRLSNLQTKVPVYIKMPINLAWDEFDKLLKVIMKYDIDGVVIGNLTKVRDPNLIKDSLSDSVKGGISGKPTQQLSDNLISKTYEHYGKSLTIIGVGGIFTAEDAYEKIKRGASLIQMITGMIFEGPQVIGEINKGLVKLLKQDGYNSLGDAVGAYHRKPKQNT